MSERGQRLVTVSRALLPELLKSRPAVESEVPEDAELEELWHHREGYGYVLRLSSTEWDPLAEGEKIPEFTPTFTEQWSAGGDDLEAAVGEYGDLRTTNPRLACAECESFVAATWPRHFQRGAFRLECACKLIDPERGDDHPDAWRQVTEVVDQ